MKRGLGKGLKELLGDEVTTTQPSSDAIKYINISDLEPNKYQPRQVFEDNALYELSESIKRSGVIQPIIVRKESKGYSIIAGERRFRASKIAGLYKIPAIVRDTSENETIEYAIVENVQREGLNVIEEAEGYQRLIQEFGYIQEELSAIIGKSRSHVANILRLNGLPESVKDMLTKRSLTMGHVKNLVGHKDAEEIAAHIVYKGLNTRQAEHLIRNWGVQNLKQIDEIKVDSAENEELKSLAQNLSETFEMKVEIEGRAGAGKMTFHFSNMEELDRILSSLSKS